MLHVYIHIFVSIQLILIYKYICLLLIVCVFISQMTQAFTQSHAAFAIQLLLCTLHAYLISVQT